MTTPTYQWQYLAGGTWTNISGAISATFTLAYDAGIWGTDWNLRLRCIVNADTTLVGEAQVFKVWDGAQGPAGTNGRRTAILEMYQWAVSAPTAFPSGTSTYTWATGAFTSPATPNSWTITPGAAVAGQTLYTTRAVYSDTGTAATSTVTWPISGQTAYPTGAAGSNGTNGSTGPQGPAGGVISDASELGFNPTFQAWSTSTNPPDNWTTWTSWTGCSQVQNASGSIGGKAIQIVNSAGDRGCQRTYTFPATNRPAVNCYVRGRVRYQYTSQTAGNAGLLLRLYYSDTLYEDHQIPLTDFTIGSGFITSTKDCIMAAGRQLFKIQIYIMGAWSTIYPAGANTIQIDSVDFSIIQPEQVKTFVQTATPTAGMRVGDYWLDSDDSYKCYYYNGSAWVLDPAQSTADAKNTVYRPADANGIPTTCKAGDLLVPTVNITAGNATFRADTFYYALQNNPTKDFAPTGWAVFSYRATRIDQDETAITQRAEAWIQERGNTVQPGSTTTAVILDALASSTTDAYKGMDLVIGAETRSITSYNGTTKTTTVTAFASAPTAGTPYEIYKKSTGAKIKISSGEGGYILLDARNVIATGTVTAEELAAKAVTADKMAADNFLFVKAVGSQSKTVPSPGDIRAYLGKDPIDPIVQGSLPVELAIKRYNGTRYVDALNAKMRDTGQLLDLNVSGHLIARESVLSGIGLRWTDLLQGSIGSSIFPWDHYINYACKGVDANGNEMVVVACGPSMPSSSTPAPVLAWSIDGGATWSTPTTVPAPYNTQGWRYERVGFGLNNSGNPRYILNAYNQSGTPALLYSDDYCVTWTYIGNYSAGEIKYGGGLWILSGNTPRYSADGGNSWVSMTSLLPAGFSPSGSGSLHVQKPDGTDTYFIMGSGGSHGQIITNTKTRILAQQPWTLALDYTVYAPGTGGGFLQRAAFNEGVIIAYGWEQITRSTDYGATWEAISFLPEGYTNCMIWGSGYGEGVWVFVGDDGVIFRSTNAGATFGERSYAGLGISSPFGANGYFSSVVYLQKYRKFLGFGSQGGNPMIVESKWLEAGSGIVYRETTPTKSVLRFSDGLTITTSTAPPANDSVGSDGDFWYVV